MGLSNSITLSWNNLVELSNTTTLSWNILLELELFCIGYQKQKDLFWVIHFKPILSTMSSRRYSVPGSRRVGVYCYRAVDNNVLYSCFHSV